METGMDREGEVQQELIGNVYLTPADMRGVVTDVYRRQRANGGTPVVVLRYEDGTKETEPIDRLETHSLIAVAPDPDDLRWMPPRATVRWAYAQGQAIAREALVKDTLVSEKVARRRFQEDVGEETVRELSSEGLQRVFEMAHVDASVLRNACIGGFVDHALRDAETHQRLPRIE